MHSCIHDMIMHAAVKWYHDTLIVGAWKKNIYLSRLQQVVVHVRPHSVSKNWVSKTCKFPLPCKGIPVFQLILLLQ